MNPGQYDYLLCRAWDGTPQRVQGDCLQPGNPKFNVNSYPGGGAIDADSPNFKYIASDGNHVFASPTTLISNGTWNWSVAAEATPGSPIYPGAFLSLQDENGSIINVMMMINPAGNRLPPVWTVGP